MNVLKTKTIHSNEGELKARETWINSHRNALE